MIFKKFNSVAISCTRPNGSTVRHIKVKCIIVNAFQLQIKNSFTSIKVVRIISQIAFLFYKTKMLHVFDCNRILNTSKHSPIDVMRWVLEDDYDKQLSRIKVVVYAKVPSLLSGYMYECPVQTRICIPSLVYLF